MSTLLGTGDKIGEAAKLGSSRIRRRFTGVDVSGTS